MKVSSFIVAMVLAAGTVHAQSLAEIAAKAKAQREATAKDGKTKPPTKAYTNKDLADVKPVAPSTTEPTEPVTAPDPIPAPQSEVSYRAEQLNRGEAYWKDRMRALVAQGDADSLALNAAQRRLAEYETEVARSRVDINGQPYVSREMKRRMLDARDEVSRLTAALQTDTLAVSRLEEEARRAGVPPGWLRF